MSVPVQFPGFRKSEPTAAGRAIVTAADAAAQRVLLSVYSQSQIDAAIGSIELPTRASLGLATTDSPTFAGLSVQEGSVNITNSAGASRIHFSFLNGFVVSQTYFYGWSLGNTSSPLNADVRLYRGGPGIREQRNGTSGQRTRLFKTYTSDTSGEWLEQDAASDASFFRIDACIGSTGGSTRGIKIGTKSGAGTPTDWIVCNADGTTIIKPPTSDPGITGALWNDAGTLKISAG